MTERVEVSGIKVAKPLYDLVKIEITPGTGVDPDRLWSAFAAILAELAPGHWTACVRQQRGEL